MRRVRVWLEEDMYIAEDLLLGVVSQGRTVEEAVENLREARDLYLEEAGEVESV